MKVGDKVVFRKIIKGRWQGTESKIYILVANDLKYGEVNASVMDPNTKEKIFTNTSCLVKIENAKLPQHFNLLTGEWEY